MTEMFEKALDAKVRENPAMGVLQAQWEFDKRLVSSALQSVGNMFPHYSRHDASHSHSILVQIERVLGRERVNLLSATDIWLLMEAAYLHDSGMIVTNAELEKLWGDESFHQYLGVLRQHTDSEIKEASQLLTQFDQFDRRGSAPPKMDLGWPVAVTRAVRLVVAEFRRRQHALKSAEVISDPSSIGLASPRTGLIPERLFGMLGKVCLAHGQSFDAVIRLPYSESGIATDEAHPRFVACMLRLGDLLDLDNGRFCPVMLETFGALPPSSAAHVAKHAAISHLRIDSRTVEVTAECDPEAVENGAYEACATWFDMLRAELRSQQAAWTRIAPMKEFGALPSEGTIEVRCKSLVSHGHVELAPDRVHRFLEGSNLYEGFESFVREIIQNATDSTLIRAWIEQHGALRSPQDIESVLENYPINVEFLQIPNEKPGRSRWRLRVTDNGIGLSEQDVSDLRLVGDRKGDPQKSRVISQMPDWFRPSGSFGIGLQSLFLVTDRVVIQTRSFLSGEALEVNLVIARPGLRPRVLSRTLPDPGLRPFGASLEIEIDFDSVPGRFSYPLGSRKISSVLERFDFLTDQELPVEAAKIKQKLFQVASASWGKVIVNGEIDSEKESPLEWFFDDETGVRVSLRYTGDWDFHGRCSIRYRGAEVTTELIGPEFYHSIADIYTKSADEVLTLNREKLKPATAVETRRRVVLATSRALVVRAKKIRNIGGDSDELRSASLALLVSDLVSARAEAGDEWRFLELGGRSLGHICDQGEWVDVSYRVREAGVNSVFANVVPEHGGIRIDTTSAELESLLDTLLKMQGRSHVQLRALESEARVIRYSKVPLDDRYANSAVLKEVLLRAKRQRRVGSRRTIPCPSNFSELELRQDPDKYLVPVEPEVGPRLLLPYVIGEGGEVRLGSLPELIEFVHKERGGERDVIEQKYREFIEFVDDLMAGELRWTSVVG